MARRRPSLTPLDPTNEEILALLTCGLIEALQGHTVIFEQLDKRLKRIEEELWPEPHKPKARERSHLRVVNNGKTR